MRMEKEFPIHVLARAAIVVNGQLLVNKNSKHSFVFLPGGHVEQGESVADALLRELQEELGLVANIDTYLGCFEYSFVAHDKSKCHCHEYNFIYKVTVPGLQAGVIPQSPEDHTVFAWVPLIELQSVAFRPEPLKVFLIQWLQGVGSGGIASSMEG
jgi:8-oxo-dGTP pyrophosphatase MutT (NUDIX family)